LPETRQWILRQKYDVGPEVQESLGAELGITPTVYQALWNPSELLLEQIYPCYYRMNPNVDGPEVAQKAKEQYDWCKTHPMIRGNNTKINNNEEEKKESNEL
jgi:hypothetical protein